MVPPTAGIKERVCDRIPSPRSGVRPIAHVVRERVEFLANLLSKLVRHVVLVQRVVHAPQPLVALT